MEDHLRNDLDQIALKVGREVLGELRTIVWDGTGLTLEELADQGLDNVVWWDIA